MRNPLPDSQLRAAGRPRRVLGIRRRRSVYTWPASGGVVVTYGLKIVVHVVGVGVSVSEASSVVVSPVVGTAAGGDKLCSLVCTLSRV